MITHLQDTVKLNNGVTMPAFGLGVFKVREGDEVEQSVKSALKAGYRLIDTAAAYGNEEGVGKAIRESGIPREEIFVTTKLWNRDQGYETTLKAFDASLKRLGLEYLDLYLIHWPVKGKYVDSWLAMEKLYKEKKVRAIGVSNFQMHHLKDVMEAGTIVPAVNQVELHPHLNQEELRQFCLAHDVKVEAWSPIMKGNLDIPEILTIAKNHDKSPAQVVLRWHLQHDIIVIPKSIHEHRIIENSQIFDFSLSDKEMATIDSLNKNFRFGPDPDNFDF
ncbi:MAG: aldo/keto reductase [Sphaerochaetaceae bacterium]|jgi:diketogulonate reductase-like aldo/keto reductase|nr:aldo/keto reductase [Sphaerochaetaceae bacterium]NLO61390.1 aldo/keto reductase [Spirochaetales bacterium]MDD2405140.1 aldo/keto reductase [Sphaerochaetaceae bacterium]MDD3670268.1 aldo/keto reductase [Sphaerochaetaceae bacterium]MDD4258908.1 aldo/keto reductase [Sphaerochaetaceae bacterium]